MAAAPSLTQQVANDLASNWSKIDWNNLQIILNEEVNAIGIRQDQAEESRKYLLDESKKFRESTDKVVRKAALPLIKAFQSEVDRLTVRSKAAEAQLINVGRTLLHVPDPSHYLEQLSPLIIKVKRLESAEEQLQLLKRQLKELEEEYGDLQNQELTIRQLREQLKNHETQAVNDVQIAVSEKEKVLRTEFEVFKKEMNESHEELLVQNEKLSRDVADLEVKNREINRLMDEAKMKLAMKESTESEQLEIISNDLENALRRAEEAEKEVERWRNKVLSLGRSSSDDVREKESATSSSKDLQIQKLMEENNKLNTKLVKEMEESNKHIEQLTKELELHIEMVERLQTQIRSQSDYEDIKKELRILRTVEFGDECWLNGENVDNGVTSSATATAEVQLGGRLKALDELLVEKNRKLQGENVELRMRNQELEELEDYGKKTVENQVLKTMVDVFGLCGSDANATLNMSSSEDGIDSNSGFSGSGEIDSDAQQCAANLLSLFMCSASSSTPTSLNDLNGGTTSSCNLNEIPQLPVDINVFNELQALIANDIQLLGSRSLNTSEIAKQCKRLMVKHNIGQRLFAKYVMNQSQGSLSELLSKPRHWNKLTDKGREAFRRMYGWVSNTKAIELLCKLSPRRTQNNDEMKIEAPSPKSLWEYDPSSPKFSCIDDLATDIQKCVSTDIEVPKARTESPTVYHSSTANQARTNSRWRHDDIPKEKIITIFQNELAKLREQETHLERAIASRPESQCNYSRTKEESKSCGNSTLKKLEELTVNSGVPSSLSSLTKNGHTSSMLAAQNGTETAISPSDCSLNAMHSLFATKIRNGLTPLTQEQLEQYGVLDVEEVVRKVKEYLCNNSISQRQFGEHVLGLSQGSVSDLLARPKPWAMLTQKGREPFIRMQLFLNDASDTNILSNASDQSSIDADKSFCDRLNDDVESREAAVDGLLKMNSCIFEIDAKDGQISELVNGEKEQDLLSANLDTKEIVKNIKDHLQSNGISQKVFGDLVLGVSPGGVSELLSKPKPWFQLSVRGRDLYAKMNAWLNNPDEISKVQRANSEPLAPAALAKPQNLPQKRKTLSLAVNGIEPARKTQRTVITDQQKEALKFVFSHDQHPSQKTIEQLSEKLSLNARTVSNWFHNYRTRQKASSKNKSAHKINNKSQAGSISDERWQKLSPLTVTSIANSMELLETTKHENNAAREQLIRHRQLIAQLEADLSSLNTLVLTNVNSHHGTKDVDDSEQTTLEMLAEELNNDLPPEPNNDRASLLGSASQKTAAEQSGNVAQVLAIVFAQRDRLRERVNQLSNEMSSLAECNSLLHAQAQSARDDNVQLYAKIKFLQSYQTGSARNQGQTMVRIEHSGEAENRYADEYERHLDPFRKFNIQEKQRKYGQLRAHDKAVLGLGRWLMGSGQSRTLFFCYLLLLHLLVFIVLYRFAYTESCQRDFQADCVASFQNHMSKYHPGENGRSG